MAEITNFTEELLRLKSSPSFAKLADARGNQQEIGLFGEAKVAEPIPQIALTFSNPINTQRDLTTSGTVLVVRPKDGDSFLLKEIR